MAYTCKTYPGGVPFVCEESKMFDDPIQGGTDNCCLIASLSAVAWTMGSFRIRIGTGTRGYYSVFLNATPVSVSGTLSLDQNYRYQYAHSRPYQSEIWPGLYEKAVAKNIHNSTADCVFSGVNWDGNPTRYLNKLSGCTVPNPINTNVSDAIISRCIGGKTKYPTVIWNDDHAYTVLGFYGQPNEQRIILRDPSGTIPGIPGIDTSGYSLALQNHFRYDCATGAMTSMGGYTVDLGNGIFGVHRNLLDGELHREFYYVAFAGR